MSVLFREGGIYQSTVDSALLPGQLSWLNTAQQFLIVRDEDAPSYYVAFTFSKRKKKLLRKFNNALIEVLPAVSTITTGHGYNTKKVPFEVDPEQRPKNNTFHIQDPNHQSTLVIINQQSSVATVSQFYHLFVNVSYRLLPRVSVSFPASYSILTNVLHQCLTALFPN